MRRRAERSESADSAAAGASHRCAAAPDQRGVGSLVAFSGEPPIFSPVRRNASPVLRPALPIACPVFLTPRSIAWPVLQAPRLAAASARANVPPLDACAQSTDSLAALGLDCPVRYS